VEADVILTWLRERRQRQAAQLASYLLSDPDARRYGWDTAKATGVRTPVTYRLLWRWHGCGWLRDGWDEVPGPGGPRRYYVLTTLGRGEMEDIIRGRRRVAL
jgi:DNA-binding PadR family transcriptional regulator